MTGQTAFDIHALSMTEEHTEQALIVSEFFDSQSTISPDGAWLAYTSNETGQLEVYVRPFPDIENGKWQISTHGGAEPRWRRDGKELFYLQANYTQVAAVTIDTESGFQAVKPEVLFTGDYVRGRGSSYDVTADGQRFIILKRIEEASVDIESQLTSLVVVENWFEDLKRLAPPAQ